MKAEIIGRREGAYWVIGCDERTFHVDVTEGAGLGSVYGFDMAEEHDNGRVDWYIGSEYVFESEDEALREAMLLIEAECAQSTRTMCEAMCADPDFTWCQDDYEMCAAALS